jgi:hypothetical protein
MNKTGAALRGVTIAGFDVCINMGTSLRTVVQDGYFDCNGGKTAGTASGVFSEPGDAGHITDNKFQVIATNTSCPNRIRDGVGVLFTGDAGEAIDNLIVQDFRVAQIYFKNSAGFELGKIWVDYYSAGGCSLATKPIGVLLVNSSAIHFDHLDVNSMQTGVVICNSVPAASIQFNDIFGNNVAGDLIQIGTPASSGVPQCGSTGGYEHAGTVVINSLRTQQGTLGPIGGYAVNFLDPTSGNSKLILNSALLSGVHGSTAPYLKFPSTAVAQFDYQVNWSQISSDLGNRSTVGGLTSVACTNVTSCTLGGTFVSRNSANPFAGVVQLTGDGTHSSGVITLTIPPITFPNCQATYQYGDSGTWPVTGLVPIVCQSTSATTVAFGWQVGSALGSGLHYNVAFNILPQ